MPTGSRWLLVPVVVLSLVSCTRGQEPVGAPPAPSPSRPAAAQVTPSPTPIPLPAVTPVPGFAGDCRIDETAPDGELCVIAVWIGGKPLTARLTQTLSSGVTTQMLQVGEWTGAASSRGKMGERFNRVVRISFDGQPRHDGIGYQVLQCAPQCTKSKVVVLSSTGAKIDAVFQRDFEGIAVIDRAAAGIMINGQTYAVVEEKTTEAAASSPEPHESARSEGPAASEPTQAESPTAAAAPVGLKPGQIIMPTQMFPLRGYAVTVDRADGPYGWRRDFEMKSAEFAVVTMRVYVYPPTQNASVQLANSSCDWQFPDPNRIASQPKLAAEDGKACIYTFGHGEAWAVYTTATRNVLTIVGVAPGLVTADATMALDQAIELAKQQVNIIDVLAPPSGGR